MVSMLKLDMDMSLLTVYQNSLCLILMTNVSVRNCIVPAWANLIACHTCLSSTCPYSAQNNVIMFTIYNLLSLVAHKSTATPHCTLQGNLQWLFIMPETGLVIYLAINTCMIYYLASMHWLLYPLPVTCSWWFNVKCCC
jgi:hypothetical protein